MRESGENPTGTANHTPRGRFLSWVLFGTAFAILAAGGQLRLGADLRAVETFTYQEGMHVEGRIIYTENPGVGGLHNPVWQNCGVYDEELFDEHVVHSMEHGAVWIAYRPADLDPREVAELEDAYRGRRYIVVSPRADLDAPIVLSAWNHRLELEEPTDRRIALFAARYAGGRQAPEAGAPCDGGTDRTRPAAPVADRDRTAADES